MSVADAPAVGAPGATPVNGLEGSEELAEPVSVDHTDKRKQDQLG